MLRSQGRQDRALKADLTRLLGTSPKHRHYGPAHGLSATWVPLAWTLQRDPGPFHVLSLWFLSQLTPRKGQREGTGL